MSTVSYCEEDIIIEGSDLHRALTEMGCTDFECTSVNRSEFSEDWENIDKTEDLVAEPTYENHTNVCKDIKLVTWFFRNKTKETVDDMKHLKIILQLEPLLDDHSLIIQNIIKSHSGIQESTIIKWLSMLIPSSVFSIFSFFNKKFRIAGLLVLSSFVSITAYQHFSDSRSLNQLRNLVSTQNIVHNLHKRGLRILRNTYRIKLDSSGQAKRKFNQLEAYRLEYLQPLCETLLRSIENCCNIFCKASRFLVHLLPESTETEQMITKFENNLFKINGEVTYKSLKQLYYVYVLVQSDMMHVMALVYNSNSTSRKTVELKLSQIFHHLTVQLKKYQYKLKNITDKYQNSQAPSNRREFRGIVRSKWQDVFIHIELLSEKLQAAYGTVGSIFEEIVDSTDDDSDEFLDSILLKINEALKQIDTARDFAEFNARIIQKIRKYPPPEHCSEEKDWDKTDIGNAHAHSHAVIFDKDPVIMDEVFEEYIKVEYLKPLYEDDDVSMERAKLDKLLEKNFMSELKDVLIEKYKATSDREAKAVLRRINEQSAKGVQSITEIEPSAEIESSEIIPPIAPPLPTFSERFDSKTRSPVPLPRNIKSNSDERKILENENNEPEKKFLIHTAFQGIKFPKFTTAEEIFVGSGENSEEELAGSDCEDDGVFK